MAKQNPRQPAVETTDKVQVIAQKICAAKKVVVFTGAGISTESGVPDYRSQGGLWDRFTPVYFDEFMSSEAARIRYWEQRMDMEKGLKHARPNTGHLSIARLYETGHLAAVITQNIDGLHQESGLPDEKVIELHGNTRRVRCMSCNRTSSIHDAQMRIETGDLAPECDCGGYLKPDTISFGQAMPEDEVERATGLSKDCDCFIVIGSTLLVQPAAHMPIYAKQSGAFLGIINLSETPCDEICDVLITGKAGEVLVGIVKCLNENPVQT